MSKNNLPGGQINLNKDCLANNRAAFAAKLIFTGMIVLGVIIINPAVFKLFGNSIQPAGNYVSNPQPVFAVTTSSVPDPSLLTIPSLNLNAPFEPLGLNSNHTIEVPKNNMGVGWFVYGAKPGQIGAAVVVGHLDSVWGSAIFANLSKVKPGDKIIITRADGSIVTYRVDSLSKFSQNNFPTHAVYDSVSYSAIRLITCSGTWDKKAGHYSDNLVVFGTQI
jgi:LPXTG-site transpeptidase (sortase) family protein